MESKRFQKRVENFVCEHCGHANIGTGYTDHCTKCLWSKHVDIHPGDREASCRGLMEPVRIEKKGEEYTIVYTCIKCGHQKRNKAAPEDNFDVLIEISSEPKKKAA